MDQNKRSEALARWQGLSKREDGTYLNIGETLRGCVYTHSGKYGTDKLPDYTDMNVLHRIVRGLDEAQKRLFVCEMIGIPMDRFYQVRIGLSDLIAMVEKKPEQFQEALIKALGLWEEGS